MVKRLNRHQVVVVSASDVVPTEAPGQGVDCDPYCVLEVLPEGFRSKQGAAEKTKYKTACKVGRSVRPSVMWRGSCWAAYQITRTV